MQAEPAIQVSHLSKTYKIYRSPRDVLLERMTRKPQHAIHQALNEINFEVARGEVLGIMGPNGAGKSTLLKIITGTLLPTTGKVQVNGKISAILELGTGFTPHNTGRENIQMGCLVLGMSPEEIARKMPQIIAFSELGDVIDRPFHTYSSGMQARLTFSVAISPDPEVLIVDEALAVGDARFQQKCFARIRAMRQAGTSILLVSHDDNTIATFCDRAMILLNGGVVADGPVQDVVPLYHKLLFGSEEQRAESDAQLKGLSDSPSDEIVVKEEQRTGAGDAPSIHITQKPATSTKQNANAERPSTPPDDETEAYLRTAYGDGRAEIMDLAIMDPEGHRIGQIRSGDRCSFYFRLRAKENLNGYALGFAIRDKRATVVWGCTTGSQNIDAPPLRAGEEIECVVHSSMWLAEGEYTVTFSAADNKDGSKISHVDMIVPLQVSGPRGIFTTSLVNLASTFVIGSPTLKKAVS